MQVGGNGGCQPQILFNNGQMWNGVLPGGGVTISGTGSGVFDAGFFPIGFAAAGGNGPGSATFSINGTQIRSGGGGQAVWDVAGDLLGQTLGTWEVVVTFPSQPVGGFGFPPPLPSTSFGFCIFLGTNSLCNNAQNNSQANPQFPTGGGGGDPWVFTNVPSGMWFDPPYVDGFDYVGTGGTLFSSITLPTGFGNALQVWANGNQLGTFTGGSAVNLGDVGSFQVRGINPLVDAALSNAFPLQIFFTGGGTGSFTQTGIEAVPEPSTWVMLAAGALVVLRRRRV